MASKVLDVNGYIDQAVERLLSEQATATKDSATSVNEPSAQVDKAFNSVYSYLAKVIHNDQVQLSNANTRIKQIRDSISQLGGIKAIFSPSCRAMRSALKDSLGAEEYVIDTYRQHLNYLTRAASGIKALSAHLKSNNKICYHRVTKSYNSIQHISHDLHK